ncbi:MAG: DUF6950 family protein [Paracoccaceae bacterium]
MAAGLMEYIAHADAPFEWSRTDCTCFMAGWCARHFGFDPIADLRGTYATQAEADAITGGDLSAFLGLRMTRLRTKSAADRGDVAVVSLLGQKIAAIAAPPFWVVKSPIRVAWVRATPVRIWGR